jgi:hypothetical protein
MTNEGVQVEVLLVCMLVRLRYIVFMLLTGVSIFSTAQSMLQCRRCPPLEDILYPDVLCICVLCSQSLGQAAWAVVPPVLCSATCLSHVCVCAHIRLVLVVVVLHALPEVTLP